MNPILEKERELSLYLEEWVNARFREWNDIYSYIYRDRCTGIYLLKSGDQLLHLLEDIIGNIGEHLIIEENQHLIPSKFSSIEQLLNFLGNFQKHIKNRYYLIENNLRGNETDMIVIDMYQMCSDIDQMVTRCQNIYQRNDTIPVPYLQAKNALSDNNVQLFVTLLKSLIKNVPYNIHKEKLDEGYFHTIIHVITSVLGMNPISEAETSDGRIDMMIEYLIVKRKPTGTLCHMTEAGPLTPQGCFPAADMKKMMDMKFEGRVYKAMIGYDDYLYRTYGDYMKLPPEDQRTTHQFEAYWL